MNPENVKNEARKIIEKLPEDVTWDDLMHAIYVRQSIEAGLTDSKSGKLFEVTIDKTDFSSIIRT